MLALGARVLADGVGFGRLVEGVGASTRCHGCIGMAGVVAAHGRTGANLYYPVMARMVTARGTSSGGSRTAPTVVFGVVRRYGWMRYDNISRSGGNFEGMDRACG